MVNKDQEQNLGLAELNSRLTNPELLIEAGRKFLDKDRDIIRFIVIALRNGKTGLDIGISDPGEIIGSLNFLYSRVSYLFGDFREKYEFIVEGSKDVADKIENERITLDQYLFGASAFANLTKE